VIKAKWQPQPRTIHIGNFPVGSTNAYSEIHKLSFSLSKVHGKIHKFYMHVSRYLFTCFVITTRKNNNSLVCSVSSMCVFCYCIIHIFSCLFWIDPENSIQGDVFWFLVVTLQGVLHMTKYDTCTYSQYVTSRRVGPCELRGPRSISKNVYCTYTAKAQQAFTTSEHINLECVLPSSLCFLKW
jgi:hypothetical protein